ncbi:MAG: metallophosphoesterase [Promethearchaeota archaeon]
MQTGEDCVNNVSCAGVGYFYFIHLTDPHVGTTGAYERYQFVINSINNLSPQPEFVVISGDLVHKGDRVDWWAGFYYTTQNLMVPYFLCVGNHDHYWYWPGEIPSFDPYFWDDEWQPTDNLHLISMNSGKDEDVWEWIGIYPLQYYWPADFLPEAEGLADSQITWLSQVIDDYPEYNKILFMHHPVFCTHSEWQFEGEDQTNGCITRNRDGLIDLLRDNAVKVVLGGHVHDEAYWYFLDTHDYLNSLGEPPNGRYWSSYSFCAGCLPMYVITRATGRYLRYRRIDVIGDEVRVWKDARFSHDKKLAEYHTDITYLFPGKQQQILTELNDTSSPGRLHVYDLDSNHVGFNHSSGVIDLEISMAYYEDETVLADTTDSLFWTPSEVISLFLEPEESYTYEIEIFMDCTLNVYGRFIEKNDSGEISTIYSDIPVSAGSVGKFFIDDEAVDHTLYIDDDGDGDFDRGIPPSDIVAPHDVGVSNVVLSDSVIQQGDSLTVHVYVENQGHYTETFDVIAYACGDMFFDPFWILNADMWSYYSDDVPRDSVSVSGGLLHVRGTILPFLDAGLTSITEFDYPITVETKLKSIYNYHCSPSLLFGTESNSCYIDLCYDTWDDGWRAEYTDTTGTHLVNWDGSISTETWYKLKLVIEEANFKAYLDDTLKVDRAWSPPDEYPKVVSLTSSCGMIGSGDFDWVKIQSKYDTKIGENTVVDLAPGESTIVSFKCSTKDITAGYYTLKSNIQPVQGETDLSDNTFTSSAVRITACGDCNADNNVDISDVVSIINYLFRDGSEPLPMLCLGDANGNGEVTIADVVYLVNYVLKSGTPPVNYCCAI